MYIERSAGLAASCIDDIQVIGSGIGSLLFAAENSARTAAAQVAPMLTQKIAAVRQAFAANDKVALENAGRELTVLLAQIANAGPRAAPGRPIVPPGTLKA